MDLLAPSLVSAPLLVRCGDVGFLIVISGKFRFCGDVWQIFWNGGACLSKLVDSEDRFLTLATGCV